MKIRDLLLAFIVVVIWGVNFTVIKLGLAGVPPMLLVALRFALASFPAIVFVKRPAVSWKYIFAYGMTVGIGQFSCLFYAVKIGMPAGISSVVLQSQAFFTLIIAAILLKEPLKISKVIGLLVSGIGLFLIGVNIGNNSFSSIPIGAFLLTLLAALFWGISNIVIKYASKQATSQGENLDMLSLVVWSSLVPPLPLLGLALLVNTPKTIIHTVINCNAVSIFSVLYLAYFATLIGYGIWGTLMAKYPAGKIAPISLLVPFIGIITAQIVLNEKLSIMQWLGGAIVILGLLIFNFSHQLKKYFVK